MVSIGFHWIPNVDISQCVLVLPLRPLRPCMLPENKDIPMIPPFDRPPIVHLAASAPQAAAELAPRAREPNDHTVRS